MSEPAILRVAVPVPLHQLFDYLPPETAPREALRPGIRVTVPFGRDQTLFDLGGLGVLVQIAKQMGLNPRRLQRANSTRRVANFHDPRITDDQGPPRTQFTSQIPQRIDLVRTENDPRARLVVERGHGAITDVLSSGEAVFPRCERGLHSDA